MDRQAILGNREVMYVVVPGGDLEPSGGLHYQFAW